MGQEQLIGMIGSLGFPIVAASYLMVKIDKTLQGVKEAVVESVITNREILGHLKRGDS